MIHRFRYLVFWGFTMGTLAASARVFDMRREERGSYLSGSLGNVTVGQNLYQNESTATQYTEGVNTMAAGEFGFFRTGERAAIRFGVEVMIPKEIKEATASLNGTVQYKIKSTGIIYAPKVGVDLNLLYGPTYRWLLSGSVGLARLNYKNIYTEVLLPEGDHTVEYVADTLTWTGSTGLEIFVMDTTTAILEVGYRSLNFSSLKYHQSVTTFAGEKSGGDGVNDINGAARTANFSGIFGGITFRIYF